MVFAFSYTRRTQSASTAISSECRRRLPCVSTYYTSRRHHAWRLPLHITQSGKYPKGTRFRRSFRGHLTGKNQTSRSRDTVSKSCPRWRLSSSSLPTLERPPGIPRSKNSPPTVPYCIAAFQYYKPPLCYDRGPTRYLSVHAPIGNPEQG